MCIIKRPGQYTYIGSWLICSRQSCSRQSCSRQSCDWVCSGWLSWGWVCRGWTSCGWVCRGWNRSGWIRCGGLCKKRQDPKQTLDVRRLTYNNICHACQNKRSHISCSRVESWAWCRFGSGRIGRSRLWSKMKQIFNRSRYEDIVVYKK